jgi:micrococcal nuclease
MWRTTLAAIAFVLALAGAGAVLHARGTRQVTAATPSPAPVFGPRLGGDIPGPPSGAIHSHVTRVVDGDTIVLTEIGAGRLDHQTSGRVARLIGVDTPEVFGSLECYGHEASNFTRSTLLGQDVRVTFDVQDTDRYGRALVYVWQDDGSFFNARLVGEGFAYQLTIPPDVRYADVFHRLVDVARNANRGLWRGCSLG